MVKKIFIDCSYLYNDNSLNTGIQRVVRKVIENLEFISASDEFEIIPVNINHRDFFAIERKSLYPDQNKNEFSAHKSIISDKMNVAYYLKLFLKACITIVTTIVPNKKFAIFLNASRKTYGLRYLIDQYLINPLKYIVSKNYRDALATRPKPLETNEGDILLLLDSTWHLNIWPSVKRAKENKVKVVAVIYDLIPLTHSQFCDDTLVEIFRQWFKNSLQYVNGYIAISNTVKDDLLSFMKFEYGSVIDNISFGSFLLGSDISRVEMNSTNVRDGLKKMFDSRDTYLIVSTIEPRKNHKYLLDVFNELWKSSIEVNLCIVGKVGWKVEEIMNRIYKHQEFNKKLFIWTDLNDNELLFCYKNSKMLIFPSIIEGFGLPIVESLTNKLPVLASDIPIHREVGKDKIGYFDLDNSEDLLKQLLQIEHQGIPEKLIPLEDYQWQSWKKSAQTLIHQLKQI